MTKLKDLEPDERNANKGTARGQKMIVSSLQEDGFGRSGLLDKNNRIIAGNKTTEASAEVFGVDTEPIIVETDGTKPVYVKRTDLDLESDVAARRLAYRDNLTSHFSFELDPEVVMADIEAGFDFEAINITLPDLGELLDGVDFGQEPEVQDVEPQIDRAAELAQEYGVKSGQLWQLGEHRLIVGDCTDKAVVERVMDGERAGCSVTDPPYGIEREGIINDREQDLRPLFDGCLANLPIANGIIIAFQSPRLEWIWCDAVRDAGHKLERMLWMYKPNDETRPWRGWLLKSEAIRVSSIGHGQWIEVHPYSQDCYVYKHDETLGDLQGVHTTVKPLRITADLIKRIGGNVYDPFLGSGTTLIACEQLNRKCRAIEIDPGYVAVTLKRWQDLTGQEPVLVDISDS